VLGPGEARDVGAIGSERPRRLSVDLSSHEPSRPESGMLESNQKGVLLLVAFYRRAEWAGQAPAQEVLLERYPDLAVDLAHYFTTGHFLGRCGCCWSGSSEEMALRFRPLADAVDLLPEESFRVVALVRLHDLSIEEVSARLGLPLQLVRRLAHSVSNDLRQSLDGDE
jgi:DNA-directed RNA polymerase specialized sigma24 family protein